MVYGVSATFTKNKVLNKVNTVCELMYVVFICLYI